MLFFVSTFFCIISYQKVRNIMFFFIDLFLFDSALSTAKIKGNHDLNQMLVKSCFFVPQNALSFRNAH